MMMAAAAAHQLIIQDQQAAEQQQQLSQMTASPLLPFDHHQNNNNSAPILSDKTLKQLHLLNFLENSKTKNLFNRLQNKHGIEQANQTIRNLVEKNAKYKQLKKIKKVQQIQGGVPSQLTKSSNQFMKYRQLSGRLDTQLNLIQNTLDLPGKADKDGSKAATKQRPETTTAKDTIKIAEQLKSFADLHRNSPSLQSSLNFRFPLNTSNSMISQDTANLRNTQTINSLLPKKLTISQSNLSSHKKPPTAQKKKKQQLIISENAVLKNNLKSNVIDGQFHKRGLSRNILKLEQIKQIGEKSLKTISYLEKNEPKDINSLATRSRNIGRLNNNNNLNNNETADSGRLDIQPADQFSKTQPANAITQQMVTTQEVFQTADDVQSERDLNNFFDSGNDNHRTVDFYKTPGQQQQQRSTTQEGETYQQSLSNSQRVLELSSKYQTNDHVNKNNLFTAYSTSNLKVQDILEQSLNSQREDQEPQTKTKQRKGLFNPFYIGEATASEGQFSSSYKDTGSVSLIKSNASASSKLFLNNNKNTTNNNIQKLSLNQQTENTQSPQTLTKMLPEINLSRNDNKIRQVNTFTEKTQQHNRLQEGASLLQLPSREDNQTRIQICQSNREENVKVVNSINSFQDQIVLCQELETIQQVDIHDAIEIKDEVIRDSQDQEQEQEEENQNQSARPQVEIVQDEQVMIQVVPLQPQKVQEEEEECLSVNLRLTDRSPNTKLSKLDLSESSHKTMPMKQSIESRVPPRVVVKMNSEQQNKVHQQSQKEAQNIKESILSQNIPTPPPPVQQEQKFEPSQCSQMELLAKNLIKITVKEETKQFKFPEVTSFMIEGEELDSKIKTKANNCTDKLKDQYYQPFDAEGLRLKKLHEQMQQKKMTSYASSKGYGSVLSKRFPWQFSDQDNDQLLYCDDQSHLLNESMDDDLQRDHDQLLSDEMLESLPLHVKSKKDPFDGFLSNKYRSKSVRKLRNIGGFEQSEEEKQYIKVDGKIYKKVDMIKVQLFQKEDSSNDDNDFSRDETQLMLFSNKKKVSKKKSGSSLNNAQTRQILDSPREDYKDQRRQSMTVKQKKLSLKKCHSHNNNQLSLQNEQDLSQMKDQQHQSQQTSAENQDSILLSLPNLNKMKSEFTKSHGIKTSQFYKDAMATITEQDSQSDDPRNSIIASEASIDLFDFNLQINEFTNQIEFGYFIISSRVMQINENLLLYYLKTAKSKAFVNQMQTRTQAWLQYCAAIMDQDQSIEQPEKHLKRRSLKKRYNVDVDSKTQIQISQIEEAGATLGPKFLKQAKQYTLITQTDPIIRTITPQSDLQLKISKTIRIKHKTQNNDDSLERQLMTLPSGQLALLPQMQHQLTRLSQYLQKHAPDQNDKEAQPLLNVHKIPSFNLEDLFEFEKYYISVNHKPKVQEHLPKALSEIITTQHIQKKNFGKIVQYLTKHIKFADIYKISRNPYRNKMIRDNTCENLFFLCRLSKAKYIENAIFQDRSHRIIQMLKDSDGQWNPKQLLMELVGRINKTMCVKSNFRLTLTMQKNLQLNCNLSQQSSHLELNYGSDDDMSNKYQICDSLECINFTGSQKMQDTNPFNQQQTQFIMNTSDSLIEKSVMNIPTMSQYNFRSLNEKTKDDNKQEKEVKEKQKHVRIKEEPEDIDIDQFLLGGSNEDNLDKQIFHNQDYQQSRNDSFESDNHPNLAKQFGYASRLILNGLYTIFEPCQIEIFEKIKQQKEKEAHAQTSIYSLLPQYSQVRSKKSLLKKMSSSETNIDRKRKQRQVSFGKSSSQEYSAVGSKKSFGNDQSQEQADKIKVPRTLSCNEDLDQQKFDHLTRIAEEEFDMTSESSIQSINTDKKSEFSSPLKKMVKSKSTPAAVSKLNNPCFNDSNGTAESIKQRKTVIFQDQTQSSFKKDCTEQQKKPGSIIKTKTFAQVNKSKLKENDDYTDSDASEKDVIKEALKEKTVNRLVNGVNQHLDQSVNEDSSFDDSETMSSIEENVLISQMQQFFQEKLTRDITDKKKQLIDDVAQNSKSLTPQQAMELVSSVPFKSRQESSQSSIPSQKNNTGFNITRAIAQVKQAAMQEKDKQEAKLIPIAFINAKKQQSQSPSNKKKKFSSKPSFANSDGDEDHSSISVDSSASERFDKNLQSAFNLRSTSMPYNSLRPQITNNALSRQRRTAVHKRPSRKQSMIRSEPQLLNDGKIERQEHRDFNSIDIQEMMLKFKKSLKVIKKKPPRMGSYKEKQLPLVSYIIKQTDDPHMSQMRKKQVNEIHHLRQKISLMKEQAYEKAVFLGVEMDKANQIEEYVSRNLLGVDLQDKAGNSLLNVAAQYGSAKICQLLIKYNANVNTQNNLGNTPLHYAIAFRYRKIIDLLLESGANENLKNANKKTPWDGL